VNDPLIWLRTCHFAAVASLAGALLFHNLVGGSAVQMAHGNEHEVAIARRRLVRIGWISFACVLVTGVGWFVVQAAQMADVPQSAVFREGTAWNILLNTSFGNVSAVRIFLAALFAASFLFEITWLAKPQTGGLVSAALALSIAGALAFLGHASAGSDTEGWVHVSADFLHLVAASAWLGSLLPLALVLNAAGAKRDEFSIAVACTATRRFSSLGIERGHAGRYRSRQ
jgi:putative copper resistance protein D